MSSIKSRTLSYSDLYNKGACSEYRDKFVERFGDGSVQLTVTMAVEQAQDWDWDWAAGAFLTNREEWYNRTGDLRKDYANTVRPYREAVQAKHDEANRAWEAAKARALNEGKGWDAAYTLADEAYNAVFEVESAALKGVQDFASKRLSKIKAEIFAEMFIAEAETGMPKIEDKEEETDDGSYFCSICNISHNRYDD